MEAGFRDLRAYSKMKTSKQKRKGFGRMMEEATVDCYDEYAVQRLGVHARGEITASVKMSGFW
jgi:hypothetical protein